MFAHLKIAYNKLKRDIVTKEELEKAIEDLTTVPSMSSRL